MRTRGIEKGPEGKGWPREREEGESKKCWNKKVRDI